MEPDESNNDMVPGENMVPEEGNGEQMGRRVLVVIGYAIVSAIWFGIIRAAVVGIPSLLGVIFTGPFAAGVWLLIVEPILVAVSAFLTLQTNIRNLRLHRVMSVVILAMTVLWPLHFATPNPYVAQAIDTAQIAAYLIQVVAVFVASWVGLRVVRARRGKLAAEGILIA